VEIVRDLFLILQQPVDRRLVTHRLSYGLGSRLAVHVKEGLVVKVIHFQNAWVEPDRVGDPEVVDLVPRLTLLAKMRPASDIATGQVLQ
jgi:hypothetical protein